MEKTDLTGNLTIKKIVVEEEAQGRPITDRILKRLSGIPIEWGQESGSKYDGLDSGKETLHLLSFKGEFLKPCPGTREYYICCGYQILNVATNCPLDCSYCILQSYFNHPNLRIFVNLEQELDKVMQIIDSEPEKIFRIGTGEFTDSLAVDSITCWSDLLAPEFSRRKNAVLEFKTKTVEIDRLIASGYRDRLIVSWSLNSPYITAREEHKAPSIEKRLKAARRCQEEGFILGFHFDPLIPHPQWKDEYIRTLELLDKYIDPKGIIWISFGSFRFMPGLKQIIRRRHPETCVLDGEFIQGIDGKMRYFKPIRIDLYSFMREKLDKWYSDLGLYLCMESDDVWEASMGWSPGNSKGLSNYLDNRVKSIFG